MLSQCNRVDVVKGCVIASSDVERTHRFCLHSSSIVVGEGLCFFAVANFFTCSHVELALSPIHHFLRTVVGILCTCQAFHHSTCFHVAGSGRETCWMGRTTAIRTCSQKRPIDPCHVAGKPWCRRPYHATWHRVGVDPVAGMDSWHAHVAGDEHVRAHVGRSRAAVLHVGPVRCRRSQSNLHVHVHVRRVATALCERLWIRGGCHEARWTNEATAGSGGR